MQIADYLGQYANTLANASAAASSSTSSAAAVTQSLVSELTKMQAGAVFEGSINAMDGSKIVLGLGNGQTIAARLEGSVNLMLGQSVFFQVKSNDGNTIAIKPFMNGQPFNPTIQKALDAAGMEMTKETMDMVNRMMEEGLPIDKQSLASMRQTLMQHPYVSLNTAVTMTKFGIPVNDQMAAQFENYQNDRHSMLLEMNKVMDGLSSVYAKAPASQLQQLNAQILSILHSGQEPLSEIPLFSENTPTVQEEGTPQVPADEQTAKETPMAGQQADLQTDAQTQEAAGQQQKPDLSAKNTFTASAEQLAQTDADAVKQGIQTADGKDPAQPRQLSELLNRHQTAQLEAQLREIFPKAEPVKLNPQLTAKEFLDAVAQQLEQHPSFDKAALGRLFSGKEYHTLLKEVMQEQWTVKPEELKTEHKVEELYQRLSRQMGQIEQLARQTGMNTGQLSQAAAQVRDNIEFMNQINQAYTYVQIPLKMANQNAHSDLYVYTNKRNLRKKEGELSAFLHLELENLGTTDVSIKMLDKNVSTKFYLEDDASYDLIEAHLPMLQERLEKLGYHCRVTVENREEKTDFVEDFLQKSQPATAASKGMVHRYSFDVRA